MDPATFSSPLKLTSAASGNRTGPPSEQEETNFSVGMRRQKVPERSAGF